MKLFREKDVKVNGERVNKDRAVKCGDSVEVYYDGAPAPLAEPVYKDENILIMNKPSGITSESFYKAVASAYPGAIFTHRLDRNTSGIMMFALNGQAYAELYSALKNRSIEKYYYCAVYGVMDPPNGVFEDYLVKDEKNSRVKIYNNKVKNALSVKTGYRTLSAYENASVLKIRLYTGRTHQIRAHLAFYGHFVLGDGKYGDDRINRTFKVKGQVLVSGEVTFRFAKDCVLSYLDGKTFCVPYDEVYACLRNNTGENADK